MMSLKYNLRNFFLAGGEGSNTILAYVFQRHPGAIRWAIHALRADGMQIVKEFPTATDSETVYKHMPLAREGVFQVLGRPPLPR